MNDVNGDENEMPRGLMAIISFVLTIGVILFTWYNFTNGSGEHWYYDWARPALMLLTGILFMLATILYIFNLATARTVFMAGIFMVPIILITNLAVLLLFTAIPGLISVISDGNAIDVVISAFSNPISIVLLGILVISIIYKMVEDNKKKNKTK